MRIERFDSNQRMSKFVTYQNTIYLAGQVADENCRGITEQTINMLQKVDVLLQEAGSDRSAILSATLYLKNMADFQEMNAIWDNWLPAGCAPARACVEANLAAESLLVEVSIVAAKVTEN